MFLEEVVVAIGKVRAIVAAAAFFSGEGRAGHECGETVKVREFVILSAGILGTRELHLFEEFDRSGEFLATAHDAYVAPHEIPDLCQSRSCGGRRGRMFDGGGGNGGARFCGK